MTDNSIQIGDLYVISYVPAAIVDIEEGTKVKVISEPLEQGGVTKAELEYLEEDRIVTLDVDYLTSLEEWEKARAPKQIDKTIASFEIIYVDPHELIPHPVNAEIYGKNERVSDLLKTIEQTGIIHPLIVNEKNQIIHGNRRREVAIQLNYDAVPVIVQTFGSEIEELEALLSHNAAREKTKCQQMAERDYWEEIEKVKAKQRQQKGTAVSSDEKGTAKDKASELAGLSPSTAKRLDKAWDKAKQYRKEGQIDKAEVIEEKINTNTRDAQRFVKEQESLESQQLKQKIELQAKIGFPCQVGELCKIKAKSDKELKIYHGLWGVVSELNNSIATVKVYDKLLILKPENAERINCSESQHKSGAALMELLHDIGTKKIEDITLEILRSLSKRHVYILNDFEEQIISLCSKRYLPINA